MEFLKISLKISQNFRYLILDLYSKNSYISGFFYKY